MKLLLQVLARRNFTARAKLWQTVRNCSVARAKLFCGPREERRFRRRFARTDSVSHGTERNFARRFFDRARKWTVSREVLNLYGIVRTANSKMSKSTGRGQKNWFSQPHGGRQKCVCVMWPILNTHTSTRSLYEDLPRYEHCFVHPKFSLQIDLLPSISRGLLRLISSDWRYESNKNPWERRILKEDAS